MGLNIIRFVGDVTTIGEEAFRECTNIFNLALPNSVTTIGKRAFYDCKNMECLTLGSGIRNIGEDAFEGCYNLYSLHIPSIQSWCKISFATKNANPLYFSEHFIINGKKIDQLNIPDRVETINRYAFIYNKQLRSVNISYSVKSIGKDAFEGCDNINKVEVESLSSWCSIQFESESANPLSIATELYYKGAKVTNIDLTSIKEIASYAFINCSSIKSLNADDSLTTIGIDAFRNCAELTSVSLGNGIAQIGKQAFMNCKALKSVTSLAQNPPILGNGDVFSWNSDDRKFYVPANALTLYTSDSQWGKYADYIEALN